MKTNTLFTIIFCLSSLVSFGQSTSDPCAEGDCAPTILTTNINHSLDIDANADNSQRTEDFKKAYKTIRQFQQVHQIKPDWQGKYDASTLTGKSCLKYYQLVSHLGYEYNQNSDFKTYIDANNSNSQGFTEEAFEHSRRSQNLKQRINKKCPEDLKNITQPSLDELTTVFMKLGQILGYFDAQGQMIKQLEPINNNTASNQSTKSKRQQIIDLKATVAQLPVGQSAKDKVKNVTDALNKATPRINALQNILSSLAPRLKNLLPKPPALLSKIGNLNNILSGLNGFKPKLARPDLMKRISGLFKKGKDLQKRIQDAVDKSKNLKTKFDDLTNKANKTKKDIEDKVKNISTLNNKLQSLGTEKDKLAQRLEDKPRKYLEELTKAVKDLEKQAKDVTNKIDIEKVAKDELIKQLKNIEDAKNDVTTKIKDLEKVVDNLTNQQSDLANAVKKVVDEVDSIKLDEAIEAAKKKMKDELAKLIPEEKLKERLDICNEDVQKILAKLQPIEQIHNKVKPKIDGFKDTPKQLLNQMKKLTTLQNKLKTGKIGQALARIDGLLSKSSKINATLQTLTGKNTGLQTKINGITTRFDKVKNGFSLLNTKQDKLKEELIKLITDKVGINGKINDMTKQIEPVEKLFEDFIKRYKDFEGKVNCDETEELKKELEAIEDELEEIEPDLSEFEDEIEEIIFEVDQIEEETKQVEEVQAQEQTLKEEFGKEINIEPVTVKEWTESFEVKRQYWEATFHPDGEVVEGFKGRYFRVNLKDADKEVKLLFAPGKYYMKSDEFRETYGSTIGAFVIEALNAMKEEDRAKVQIFIQGSADNVGSATFRGNLNEEYRFTDINVLPLNESGSGFNGNSSYITIPEKNFRNSDLPNLRGQFLKEMIRIYSKKLTPILLEGEVKKVTDKNERNAVIYLFIPDSLVKDQ